MAYKIMRSLIANSDKSKEALSNMLDVYYGAGRLTDEQYQELASLISSK